MTASFSSSWNDRVPLIVLDNVVHRSIVFGTVLILNLGIFVICRLDSACGSSCSTSGRRAARSRPIPRFMSQVAAQQDRCMPEKACKGWFGANHSDQVFSFTIQELLPDLHKLFFFFLPVWVFLCFHHPAIIVHEVILCLLCFIRL